ncbi:MAG: ATP synthase F1 subunit delta [Oscillospiraceae bacterium]|nr:ATP synthase F1 subunit delta [Oscillospiraceae bacterium]
MSQVGSVYGGALYSLCKDENISDSVLNELDVLQNTFAQTDDFLRLLSAPNIAVQERCSILDDCFRDKVHLYVLNFLKILTQKGFIKQFSCCVDAYRNLYNDDHNILPVTAVTAVSLTREQSDRLAEKLSAITGKTAQLHNRVDPDCLGGVILDYDGKRIDGSVAGRLASIEKLLKNTVL